MYTKAYNLRLNAKKGNVFTFEKMKMSELKKDKVHFHHHSTSIIGVKWTNSSQKVNKIMHSERRQKRNEGIINYYQYSIHKWWYACICLIHSQSHTISAYCLCLSTAIVFFFLFYVINIVIVSLIIFCIWTCACIVFISHFESSTEYIIYQCLFSTSVQLTSLRG